MPAQQRQGPARVPTDKLDEALVKVLSAVMRSLREKDSDRFLRTGNRRYWVVESPEKFARFVRVNSTVVARSPLQTADFSTVYTSFSHDVMVWRILDALREAQDFEASRH